jgi:hypothetical protein
MRCGELEKEDWVLTAMDHYLIDLTVVIDPITK